MPNVVPNVEAGIYFLAGIEDIFRVKDMLSYLKEFKHLLGVHEVEEWSANNTVIVFTTDVAFKFHRSFVEGIRHLFYQGRCSFVGKVEERVEVEVSISTVTMDG